MVGNNEPFVPVLLAASCAAHFNDCTTPDYIGADIAFVLQDTENRRTAPASTGAGDIVVLLPMRCFVFSGGRYASLKEFPGNGCRSNSGCGKLENELYHSSGFRVRFHSAIGAFAIPVRANFALVFAALHFGVLGAFGLDGHIAAVILADQILESHIHTAGIALVLIAVKIIVDGNEPGVKQREHTLNEIAGLNAVSSKPGKVFYDDTVDLM